MLIDSSVFYCIEGKKPDAALRTVFYIDILQYKFFKLSAVVKLTLMLFLNNEIFPGAVQTANVSILGSIERGTSESKVINNNLSNLELPHKLILYD